MQTVPEITVIGVRVVGSVKGCKFLVCASYTKSSDCAGLMFAASEKVIFDSWRW